ncbi:hypothetical protein STEG23_037687 [Scotinomys teguina]
MPQPSDGIGVFAPRDQHPGMEIDVGAESTAVGAVSFSAGRASPLQSLDILQAGIIIPLILVTQDLEILGRYLETHMFRVLLRRGDNLSVQVLMEQLEGSRSKVVTAAYDIIGEGDYE